MTRYSTPPPAELVLVELARRGDAQATEQLMADYVARMRYLAWSFSRSSGIEAEDLLQEVAFRFCAKWSLIIQSPNPLPYARVVAKNHLINKYHARRRQVRVVSYPVEVL